MNVRLPSGLLVQGIPDGTPKDVIRQKLIASGRATYADFDGPAEQYDPTQDMSGWQKFVAGYGKAAVDLGRGVEQGVRALVPGVSEREKALQTEIDNAKERDANLMHGAGLAGNLIGGMVDLVPTLAIPGANTYAGATALGALTGALGPVASDESRLSHAGLGALGGFAGRAIGGGLSRVLSPKTDPAARLLMREGVVPTPGQVAGGLVKRFEEGATSIPIAGDLVRTGQRRAVEDFNKAAINRALKPIGKHFDDLGVSGVGRKAVEAAEDAISSAYDDLLPKLKVAVDADFLDDMTSLSGLTKNMPEARASQFESILKNEVFDKFTPQGNMSGETMKAVESKLGQLTRQYSTSLDADQRMLGDALKEAQATIRNLVARGNPDHSKTLKSINTAYANLLRVENAAARIGSPEGMFSPAQLRAAVRQMDASLRKRGFAHGNSLMQDLAEAGEKVLGKSVPDSGTPFRLGAAGVLGAGSALANPAVGAGLLGTGAMYGTRAGQKTMMGLLAQRPELFRLLGGGLEKMQPYTGLLGAQMALQGQ